MTSTSEKIELRRATPKDFDFALKLYLVTMKPLTAELMTWDEAQQCAGFAEQWNVADVQMITLEDQCWLAASSGDGLRDFPSADVRFS